MPSRLWLQNSPTVDIFRIGTKYLRRLHAHPQALMKAIPIMAHPVALKIAPICEHMHPLVLLQIHRVPTPYITTPDTAARLWVLCHGDFSDRDEGIVVITVSPAETRAQAPEDLPPCNPRLIHTSPPTSLHFSKPLQATRSSRDTKGTNQSISMLAPPGSLTVVNACPGVSCANSKLKVCSSSILFVRSIDSGDQLRCTRS